ncbi:MFS transporter [Tautonia sociabilis]|uniref:MFS transporter n=1 Tax=Tautonia sociabilis TaxID=2080755 RepID=A0A432MKJ6_9BACT|nr:MFS transporter [Tautonia sociabilis]RUL87931.1 MFS transporter [Tautonia sociabilis]
MADRTASDRRERLLRVLAAATFLIFFQAYMVAPLIPRLAEVFGVSGRAVGLMVPAYMIPYGVATLFYGLLSDRLGRRPILVGSLVAAALAVALLSLGYDMTQPLLAGIVTMLGGRRGGQAMGLNVVTLFTGFGLGSLLFGEALRLGFAATLVLFAAGQALAALVAIPLFGAEGPPRGPRRPEEMVFKEERRD